MMSFDRFLRENWHADRHNNQKEQGEVKETHRKYLKLVPDVRSHAVANRKVELNFGIRLTGRGVNQIATQLT